MLEALPDIWDFFQQVVAQYWSVIMASSVLAGFFTLAVLDRVFHIFDILKH